MACEVRDRFLRPSQRHRQRNLRPISNASTTKRFVHPKREGRSFWRPDALAADGIGCGSWAPGLGGRTYLRHVLAERLNNAQSEQAAIESIDALLRLTPMPRLKFREAWPSRIHGRQRPLSCVGPN